MDKNNLLSQAAMEEADLELAGVGTVRVRALTRYEVLLAGKTAGEDHLAMEQEMIALGMVDPVMTKSEVREWQKVSPLGQITEVVNKINALSGIGAHAVKESYKSFRDEPES